jgi:dolichol-phosphate mannosyltransferase
MAYDLAIVLPTFNESGNVGPIVDRLEGALRGIRYEVIFVDDDSPDGTADVVRRLARAARQRARAAKDWQARAGVGVH